MKKLYWLLVVGGILALMAACGKPAPTSTTPPVTYSVPDLKYMLFARYEPFWCDPDLYPIARPDHEQQQAEAQFATIRANKDEFAAILKALGLSDKTTYTPAEMLAIYQQHKKLTLAVEFTPSRNEYHFVIRVGEGQGFRYEGTMTASGKITVILQELSINTCPICLTRGTLIATPAGPVPVEDCEGGDGSVDTGRRWDAHGCGCEGDRLRTGAGRFLGRGSHSCRWADDNRVPRPSHCRRAPVG